MIETWKQDLDEGNQIGDLSKDLSKVFDTINHILRLLN